MATMSLCVSSRAPAASRRVRHSSQVLPVAFCTASELIFAWVCLLMVAPNSQSSFVHVVRNFQPVLDFVIDLLDLRDRNAMRDAVLLGEAAGVDQSALRFGVFEREAHVDARVRGRL